jgi:hypothetical protein
VDPPPARHGGKPWRLPAGGGDRGEVPVVAERLERQADGGVDVPVGLACGAQRDLEGLQQQLADRNGAAARAVDHGQLGVFTEAAAGPVDRLHLGGDRQAGWRQAASIGHQYDRLAAQCQKARAADPVHQEPPEVTLPDPPEADGSELGAWRVEPESLEPASEPLDWLDPLVTAVWLALWWLVVPMERAAMAEQPAVSASAPVSSQRVRRDTRRRPASRVAAAARSDGI